MSYCYKRKNEKERFDENFIIGRLCVICGKEVPKSRVGATCSNPCRKINTQNEIKEAKETQMKMIQERKHNRKCIICNKPCWPNYFFCIKHHAGKGELYL